MQAASSKPWSRRKPRTSSQEMAPDEAADILSELEKGTSEEIMDEMDSAEKTEVQELLEFEKTPPAA